MAATVKDFVLVGARFSKLIVDEGASILQGEQSLAVEFLRSRPSLSLQKMGDRPVVELRVSVVATLKGEGDTVLDKVFHIECTAGFVGADRKNDGNVEGFTECIDEFSRYVYWMLRERLDSIFSVTSLKGTHLPWDIIPTDIKPRKTPGPPTQPKRKPKSKQFAK